MAKKQNLSYQDIETSLKIFKEHPVAVAEVGYEILKAFGKSDADIRRYREGKGVLASYNGLLIKGLLGFRSTTSSLLTSTLEEMKNDMQIIKAAPKIIAVSDGATILAYDMREKESYENPLSRLYCDFAFFYPLCGVEKFQSVDESPADIKAAEKLAKLHDELRAYNDFSSKSELHDLNIFIARLLFCLFAEDTGIFEENLFTGSVSRYTKEDGSDLADYLNAAFNVMDISVRNEDTMKIISQFPYVNGGLFSKTIQIPKMGFRARKIIIECGELNWQNINPDIFGSMIQSVVDPNVRANQGMHYTSVPNIMKVISPLFLEDLQAEYQKQLDFFEQKKRLSEVGMMNNAQFLKEVKPVHDACKKLLIRMSRMKFFDPACGSGNFLIITYKMLRLLEMDILKLMRQIVPELDFVDGSCITLSQFYGIEILDFPHEITMLSLWLAEHQMNKRLHDDFAVNTRALPLHNITQIQCGNSCLLDWNVVCPHEKDEEVFVFGNPPFDGKKEQSIQQKKDVQFVFEGFKGIGILDYVSCWYLNALHYINDSICRAAFVSTNSICQGEHVAVLWPILYSNNICIDFAYTSFKWENNARNNAAVHCIIVGFSKSKSKSKYLFVNNPKSKVFQRITVDHINAYLLNAPDIIMHKLGKNISKLPPMNYGSIPIDNGALIIDDYDIATIKNESKDDLKYIRTYIGGAELLNDKVRKCIWIENESQFSHIKSNFIKERIKSCKEFRHNSSRKETISLENVPYRFGEIRQPNEDYMVLPKVSSERRNYLPIALYDKDVIANGSSLIIQSQDLIICGILSSTIHMIWLKTIGGKMKSDYQYSAQLCYNTFPFPTISAAKKKEIKDAAEEVLITRAGYPARTLAELYDPDKMPQNLRDAHQKLDDIVDSCYPGYPFANDEARLEGLFKLYEKMTAKK